MSVETEIAELRAVVTERFDTLTTTTFALQQAVEKQNGRVDALETRQAYTTGADEARAADRRFMVQIVAVLLGAGTVATGLAAVLLRAAG